MSAKGSQDRQLVDVFSGIAEQKSGLTAAQIALAYKAALSDFVGGKTSRSSFAEVSRGLSGSLLARKQEVLEEDSTSVQRVKNYY